MTRFSGHTGRLCAKCVAGYFVDTRRCLPCPSAGTQGAMVAVFALLFLGLLVLLFADAAPDGFVASIENDSRALTIMVCSHSGYSIPCLHSLHCAMQLFHAQQLGVLLAAGTAFPTEVLPWLSGISAGSVRRMLVPIVYADVGCLICTELQLRLVHGGVVCAAVAVSKRRALGGLCRAAGAALRWTRAVR